MKLLRREKVFILEGMAYAQNRKIFHDYEILDKFEAGLVLFGSEVKSIQLGKITLAGGVVKFQGGRLALLNVDIAPYQVKNTAKEYNPTRPRYLLLRPNEIKKLAETLEHRQLTILPISVYNKNGLIKLEIGIAKRKNKADKREALKKKSTKREMRQHKA